MIKLGSRVRDKVTGHEGITSAYCVYLYGCAQYNIVGESKDGKIGDTYWFDEGRIEFVSNGVNPEEVLAEKNGGPQREAPNGIQV